MTKSKVKNVYLFPQNSFAVYPNPNNGEFVIEFEFADMQNVQVRLTDVVGKTIYMDELKEFKGKYAKRVTLGEHASGMYNLEIITDNFIKTEKLVIK